MKSLNTLVAVLLLSSSAGLLAHDGRKKGEPENTVGLMSEPVIQARLKALGYDAHRILKTYPLRYEVEATKDGKFLLLDFHPQLGTMKPSNFSGTGAVDLMPKEFPRERPIHK